MSSHAALLWVDHALVVVNKPAGISLATRRSEPGAAVERLLATVPTGEMESFGLDPAALLLVHRLDVGTSGVVVLARDGEIHRDLVRAFAERHVGKTYLALVWGHPRPAEGRWSWPLGPDRSDRRKMRVDPAGRRAESGYRVVASVPHVALLRLSPATGRTHQLRVHCAHAGHPIVGDDLYGGPRHHGVRDPRVRHVLNAARPYLHAWRLHLPATPSTAELIVHADLPEDFATALSLLGLAPPPHE